MIASSVVASFVKDDPTFAALLEEYCDKLRLERHRPTERVNSAVSRLIRDITTHNMSAESRRILLRARIQEVHDLAVESGKEPRRKSYNKGLCAKFREHVLKYVEENVPVEALPELIRLAGMKGPKTGDLAKIETGIRATYEQAYPDQFGTPEKIAAFDLWRKNSAQHLNLRRLLEISQKERAGSNPPLAGDEEESVRLLKSGLLRRAGMHALRHSETAKCGQEMDGLDQLADAALSSAAADCEISTGVSRRCFPVTRASIINLVNFAAAR